jgi:hypothetical protein
MVAVIVPGQRSWSVSRDSEGYKTYKIIHRVVCDEGDGPNTALTAFGLPVPGQIWEFDNDYDPHAWCTPESSATPVVTNEPNTYFDVEHNFTTKPLGRDATRDRADPLSEPPKISISFSKTTEEASHDRFGRMITNSAWEQMRGKHVEFDTGHIIVKIEQNFKTIDLPSHAAAYQTVNMVTLWGMPPRTVKLSNSSIEENYYTPTTTTTTSFGATTTTTTLAGATTTAQATTTTTAQPTIASQVKYYHRNLEFEVNAKGWDRDLLDEGTKVLWGRWKSVVTTSTTTTTTTSTPAGQTTAPPTTTSTAAGATTTQAATTTTTPIPQKPDPVQWELLPIDSNGTMPNRFNPTHFMRYTDRSGNPLRVILNGKGLPAGTVAPVGLKYVCIVNGPAGSLADTNSWVATPKPRPPNTETGQSTFPTWDPFTYYYRGDLIQDDNGAKYIATDTSINRDPVIEQIGSNPVWQPVPANTPQDQGIYVSTASYVIGDMVEDALIESAGIIHVERYSETDFVLVLGIPSSIA